MCLLYKLQYALLVETWLLFISVDLRLAYLSEYFGFCGSIHTYSTRKYLYTIFNIRQYINTSVYNCSRIGISTNKQLVSESSSIEICGDVKNTFLLEKKKLLATHFINILSFCGPLQLHCIKADLRACCILPLTYFDLHQISSY